MQRACRTADSTSPRNVADTGDSALLCVCVPGWRGSFTHAEAFWRGILPAPAEEPSAWRIVDGTRGDVQALTEKAEVCVVSADHIDGTTMAILQGTRARNPTAGLIAVVYELHHIDRIVALEAGADLVLPMIEDGRLVGAAVSALRRRIPVRS